MGGGKSCIYLSIIKVKNISCSVTELFRFNSVQVCTLSFKAAASLFSQHSETIWQASKCLLESQQSPWQQRNNHTSSRPPGRLRLLEILQTFSVTHCSRWAGFPVAIHWPATTLWLESRHQYPAHQLLSDGRGNTDCLEYRSHHCCVVYVQHHLQVVRVEWRFNVWH